MNGLALWLDSMNINGNNNYGITDGDGISKWTDLSGSNNHAVQSNADSQPKKTVGVWYLMASTIPSNSTNVGIKQQCLYPLCSLSKNQQCQHGRRFKR